MRAHVDLDWLPMPPLHRLGGERWGLPSLLSFALCAVCSSGIPSPIAARISQIRGEIGLENKSQF